MTAMGADTEMRQLMQPSLEVIDEELANAAEPIHCRPLLAAMIYVHDFVVSVQGGSKDNYLSEQWFGEIVRISTDWYQRKYGDVLLAQPETIIEAAVPIYSTPFELRVPLSPTRPGKESGTAVIHFTPGLLDDEDPMQWIVRPPPLADLNDSERASLRRIATDTSTLTRSTFNALIAANLRSRQMHSLAAGLKLHLGAGVGDLCSLKRERRSNAAWEFHLALEMALKLVLLQRGATPPPTHNLNRLRDLALRHGLSPTSHLDFAALPSDKTMIKHRYGEVPPPTTDDLLTIYDSVLRAVNHCTNSLERGFFSTHPTIMIKAPPWHPSRRNVLDPQPPASNAEADKRTSVKTAS